jgi:beta-glucosidase
MMLTGYVVGVSPPGKSDSKIGVKVLANLLKGHGRAYRIIHAEFPRAWVGFAHHMRVFQAYNWWNPGDLLVAAFIDDFWNNQILNSIKSGHLHLSVPFVVNYDEEWPELRGALDFVGVNYYTRDFVKLDFSSPALIDDLTKPGLPHNDLGWEIYPEGLYKVVMRAASFGWPVVITENGIADAADSQRGKFLCDHLTQLSYAIDDGADVRGYLHWALVDNWEWVNGFAARFGLVKVDYATQARTVRAGAKVLSDAAATNVLSPTDCPAPRPGS